MLSGRCFPADRFWSHTDVQAVPLPLHREFVGKLQYRLLGLGDPKSQKTKPGSYGTHL